jgi:aminotransferase EvaB
MARILVNDLERHTGSMAEDIRAALDRVLTKGWFVLGPECAAFEQEFAAYCGAPHCIGVANGTEALELALRALGVGSGKRVATVANAGCYATTAILQVGADPVYVDVSPTNRLMDLATLAELTVTGALHAVVVTHLFGLMHDVRELRLIADRAGIPLIEDCAQAVGARVNGKHAGTVGHVGCFSFYPTKNLGALGDGGAVMTSDPNIAAKLTSLRQYGWTSKYCVEAAGGRNSRLDELQAAVLRVMLPRLDGWNARRRDIARRYTERIRHPNVSCPVARGDNDVAHLYAIEASNRTALRAHLAAGGIASDIHYPIPDHQQPGIASLRPWPSLPVTEHLANRILTLPCFPELTDPEADHIICCINSW